MIPAPHDLRWPCYTPRNFKAYDGGDLAPRTPGYKMEGSRAPNTGLQVDRVAVDLYTAPKKIPSKETCPHEDCQGVKDSHSQAENNLKVGISVAVFKDRAFIRRACEFQ